MAEQNTDVVDLLVYSEDSQLRAAVIQAVGNRPGKGLPKARWTEAATAAGAEDKIRSGSFPVVVFDAETTKVSGNVVAKDLLEEDGPENTPKIIMLVARPQDEWLSRWAGAARIVQLPVDPIALQEAVAAELAAK